MGHGCVHTGVWCYTLDSTCGAWQAVPGDSGWLRWASHAHQGGKGENTDGGEVGSPAQRSVHTGIHFPLIWPLPIPLVQHKALSVSGPSEVTDAGLGRAAFNSRGSLGPPGVSRVPVAPSSGEIPSDEALLVNEHKVPPGNPPVCQVLVKTEEEQGPEPRVWMRRCQKRGKDGAGKWSPEKRLSCKPSRARWSLLGPQRHLFCPRAAVPACPL